MSLAGVLGGGAGEEVGQPHGLGFSGLGFSAVGLVGFGVLLEMKSLVR